MSSQDSGKISLLTTCSFSCNYGVLFNQMYTCGLSWLQIQMALWFIYLKTACFTIHSYDIQEFENVFQRSRANRLNPGMNCRLNNFCSAPSLSKRRKRRVDLDKMKLRRKKKIQTKTHLSFAWNWPHPQHVIEFQCRASALASPL